MVYRTGGVKKKAYIGPGTLLIADSIKYQDASTLIYRIDKALLGKPLFKVYTVYKTDTTIEAIYVAAADSAEITFGYADLPLGVYPNVSNDSITRAFNSYLQPQVMDSLAFYRRG